MQNASDKMSGAFYVCITHSCKGLAVDGYSRPAQHESRHRRPAAQTLRRRRQAPHARGHFYHADEKSAGGIFVYSQRVQQQGRNAGSCGQHSGNHQHFYEHRKKYYESANIDRRSKGAFYSLRKNSSKAFTAFCSLSDIKTSFISAVYPQSSAMTDSTNICLYVPLK